jgi:arylsulfatase A
MLSGKQPQVERDVLLYFDSWNLQCARMGRWKLHFARYNSFAFNPPPATGRVNLPLTPPELFDVESDVDESYDIAPGNPKVVAEIQARVEKLIAGFPEQVRTAYAQTKASQVIPSAVGAVPRSAAGNK